MSAQMPPLAHRQLRAPREHGQALIDLHSGVGFQPASVLAGWKPTSLLREELVASALAHTRQYRDVSIPATGVQIVMSGHQPELFHAGVWFKNFLLSSLAARHEAVAINLIVDNDAVDHPTLRVPTGTRGAPRVDSVSIDASSDGIPYEQRTVLDHSLFASLDERVTDAVRPWIASPLVRDLWRYAREASKETNQLGQVVARARHRLEGEWGLNTLEVPLSTVFAQRSFHTFATNFLLRDAARFRDIYKAALLEYRAVNRIRSRAHPVPDLAEEDGWQEVPLWIWSNEKPHRKRLFVRQNAAGWELTDREQVRLTLPADDDGVLTEWNRWEASGIKIRPRALMTTMYARLVLCDLFIHGIGGAKYDELTDAIIRRFFGIEPPRYVTATATVQLPLNFPRVTSEELLAAQHEARELRFHPELLADDGASELVARKRSLLRDIPPRGAKLEWHRELVAINDALLPFVEEQQQRLNDRVALLAEQHRLTRLLGSREFSFCIFPADFLRGLLLDLSRATP